MPAISSVRSARGTGSGCLPVGVWVVTSAAIGRRADGLDAADVRVAHPADVPQLEEHPAARGVHGVGDSAQLAPGGGR